MAYGEIKVDTITFTDGGIDKSVSISGLVQNPTFSGNITVTGTISGDTLQGQTVSGVTVTGTTAQFTSGTFTSITGTTATITSGVFASGTAAAPSVSIGTTDNGLYSPGTDQVAISTNGTGRLFVDENGNVGINGNNPNFPLEIEIDSASAWSSGAILDGTTNKDIVGLGIRNSNASSSAETSLLFLSGASNNAQHSITSVKTASNQGALVFRARTASSASAETLRITHDGKLGLGTSSPGATLDVRAGANNTAIEEIAVFARPDAAVRATIEKGLSTGNGISFGTTTGQPIALRTDNTERLYIDNTGNVGIGTTSPDRLLEIAGSGGANSVEFRLNATDGGERQITFTGTGSTTQIIKSTGTTDNSLVVLQGANERARIDSSGRLLVGTSTAYTLGSSSSWSIQAATTGIAAIRPSNDTNPCSLTLTKTRSNSVGSYAIVQANDNIGIIDFAADDGTDYATSAARIIAQVDGTPGANDMPGRLTFSTNAGAPDTFPKERIRITSGGEVWINTTTGTVNTSNFGTVISANGNIGLFYTSRNVSGGGTVAGFYGNAGNLSVRGDGDCENTNNSYTGISDIKLKENIVDANSQWDDLKALQVRNYNFKAETGYNTHTQIGLIAQEVELVSPGLVGESIDEETGESTKSVNYSVLYMKAVKALQEAMERIEVLEASNTDLLARVSALESA